MMRRKLSTCFSPELIPLYDIDDQTIVVVIDVLRATSTVAALIHMGVAKVIPVNSIEKCMEIGRSLGCITAGERNGKVIPGLDKGNSPMAFSPAEVAHKTVALTTTNGTMLINELLLHGASHIITGAFVNIDAVCEHIFSLDKDVLLACAGWKGFVNSEDSLFAGEVVHRLQESSLDLDLCDASILAKEFFHSAIHRYGSVFAFMEKNQTSHFLRLMGAGAENDLEICCQANRFPCLPFYQNGVLAGI